MSLTPGSSDRPSKLPSKYKSSFPRPRRFPIDKLGTGQDINKFQHTLYLRDSTQSQYPLTQWNLRVTKTKQGRAEGHNLSFNWL